MAYSMSVSLVSPSDTAEDQAISTNLTLSYTGTALPWEYWVGGAKKLSYPIGSLWDSSVNPIQLDISGGAWAYDTTYSWYVRYAHTAATRTWVTDHWEFTGLEYTNTATRTFTTIVSPIPAAPINPTPEHDSTDTTLDDTTLTWEDGGRAETYDVYFRETGAFFEKIASDITDLSISILEFLPNPTYVYGELYLWCVIAKNEYGSNYAPPEDFGIGYGGTIWEFNAIEFDPPLPSGITLSYAGDDDGVPTGDATGENNMVTLRKLIAAANDKIWVEDI